MSIKGVFGALKGGYSGLRARWCTRARPMPDPAPPAPQTAPPTFLGIRAHAWRRAALALSFVCIVVLPTLTAAAYYGLIAADRYTSGAGFAVRGMSGGMGGADMVQSFTGLAGGSTTISDSYIVLNYLRSRDVVERLERDFDLRAAFDRAEADALSRLPPDVPIEAVVAYWDGMTTTSFDLISGVMTFEVQAFRPDDAQRIAELVLGYVTDLVNELSESARQDSVRFAREEVARAEGRLRAALEDIRAFRNAEQSINPQASARAEVELVTALEKELIDVRARMAALAGSVSEAAPTMVALRRQAQAMEAEIARRASAISQALPDKQGQDGATALSELLAAYEALEVEKTFAQQAYASALSSLESARMEADRQQRYLAVYAQPLVPQNPAYPRRAIMVALVAAVAFCFWAIATLVAYAVRDHLS
jgi:capsular polysaccharide transport system permease protein